MLLGADRWERAYGVAPSPEWAHALRSRTPADVARGIARLEADDSGRLPTAGQFAAMCREHQPGTFAGAAAPTPLPSLAQLSAPRAEDSPTAAKYREMWRRMRAGGRLTREELEDLPPVKLQDSLYVYPALHPEAKP